MSASVVTTPPGAAEPSRYPQPRVADPLDPPPAHLAWQRAAPLTRVSLWDGRPVWLVTGHAAARAALRSPHVSSDPTRPGLPTLTRGRARVLPGFFIQMDDPEHARLRRMVSREFVVGRIAALRPGIAATVAAQLEVFAARRPPADLLTGFAHAVPSAAFADLLGVPGGLRAAFCRHATTLVDLDVTPEQSGDAGAALHALLGEAAARRAAEPGDDLLSRLVGHHERAGGIDRADAVGLAMLLVVAGHDTASTMIAMSVLTLLRHPAELARLRERPELVPGAVEELLRLLAPIHRGLPRLALADVELDGHRVRAGEGLVVDLASANRDPAVFHDPGRLDVGRDARAHLAFGHGVHHCVGHTLARALLQEAVPAVFARLSGLALVEPAGGLRYRHDMPVYGARSVPVTWDRAPDHRSEIAP